MTKKPASKRPASKLGRGLSALMADIAVPEISSEKPVKKPPTKKSAKRSGGQMPIKTPAQQRPQQRPQAVHSGISEIPIDRLERNPSQPRRYFDKVKLAELTSSIKQKGVLQPILVRPLPASYAAKGKPTDNRYQIVAGERRWQAAQSAGLEFIPALIREFSDRDVLEIGVIENVQRTDLNPIEEAEAYQALIEQFGRKQSEIAKATGKSRPHVANCLRLLKLPVLAQDYLKDGKITAGHARAILAAPDPQALADIIIKGGLSVRAAEAWARQAAKPAKPNNQGSDAPDANVRFIERELSQHMGMEVSINHKTPGGSVTIKYKTMEQMDDLVKRLRNS